MYLWKIFVSVLIYVQRLYKNIVGQIALSMACPFSFCQKSESALQIV